MICVNFRYRFKVASQLWHLSPLSNSFYLFILFILVRVKDHLGRKDSLVFPVVQDPVVRLGNLEVLALKVQLELLEQLVFLDLKDL